MQLDLRVKVRRPPSCSSPSCGRVHTRLALAALLALALLTAGCKKDPSIQKQKFLVQGNSSFSAGNYSEALIYYGRALQADPSFAEAHYKLALTQMKLGNRVAAYQELSRAVGLQPDNWKAQQDLGRFELLGGKRQEAKDRALLILRSDPKNADAQMLLSDADVALGNMKDALQEAKDAIALSPDRSFLYINLGHIEAQLNHLPEAEQNFQKAQSLDPGSVVPLLTLGKFYQQQKRRADAEKAFQDAVKLDPKNVVPRGDLANLYFTQGQEAQGEKVLEDAKEELSTNPNAYRLLGDYYLIRGQYPKALSEFASLSTKYPNDLTVKKDYTQLLIMNDQLAEANAQIQEILKKAPQDAVALVLEGQLQVRQNHPDEAITTLQRALKIVPDSALGHYHLGLAYSQKSSFQQADSEWREAVRLRPTLTEAWVALGRNSILRADWRTLEDISNELKKYAPNSVDAYLFHATARMNRGDASGAEADLKYVLLRTPTNPLPYIRLAQLRVAQKRWNDAETYFKEALSHDANSIEAITGLAGVDLAKNKPEDAARRVQAEIDRNPNSSALYLLQGQILLRSRHLELAEAAFLRCVELDRKNVSALVFLAQTREALDKTDKAIEAYQQAIELSPRNISPYVGLGSLYEKSGNWQSARDTYQKGLAVQPDDPLTCNNLAYILLEHGGDSNVALTLAQTARKGLPNLPNSADTLGWAYYHTGAYSSAAPVFEAAVKSQPNNQTYHFHLGLTYQKLQDSNRAKAELEKAITLDPKSPIADQARRAITSIAAS